MGTYTKPSIGRRERISHRLIHYLHKNTSNKHPDWRDATIEFLHDLLMLAEDKPWINILIHRADGFRVYYGSVQVVFLHLRQKHILVHTNRDYLLWEDGYKLFSTEHKGSHDRMWKVSKRCELAALISYLDQLAEPAEQAESRHSRTVPVWVQNFVLERDGHRCVACGNKETLCFDHIIPFSRGGASDSPANLQILCSKCNSKKRDNLWAYNVG